MLLVCSTSKATTDDETAASDTLTAKKKIVAIAAIKIHLCSHYIVKTDLPLFVILYRSDTIYGFSHDTALRFPISNIGIHGPILCILSRSKNSDTVDLQISEYILGASRLVHSNLYNLSNFVLSP